LDYDASKKELANQYRSIIFHHTLQQKKDAQLSIDTEQDNWHQDILTEIVPATTFYRAEEYHQKYLDKNNLG
jgi:peptide-methionine (S)-S-oxide reductase